MEEWIIQLLNEYGYMGIFTIIALENIFPPIPSEVILSFAGFMTTQTHLTVVGAVITSTTGSLVGALILYGIGYYFHIQRLESWIDKWGNIFRIKQSHLNKAFTWFQHYGYWTVFLCRMIPLVRSLISIPAGMAKMNLFLFAIFTIMGSLIWNFIIIFLGAQFGESWHTIVSYFDLFSHIIYFMFGIGLLSLIFWYIYHQHQKKA